MSGEGRPEPVQFFREDADFILTGGRDGMHEVTGGHPCDFPADSQDVTDSGIDVVQHDQQKYCDAQDRGCDNIWIDKINSVVVQKIHFGLGVPERYRVEIVLSAGRQIKKFGKQGAVLQFQKNIRLAACAIETVFLSIETDAGIIVAAFKKWFQCFHCFCVVRGFGQIIVKGFFPDFFEKFLAAP